MARQDRKRCYQVTVFPAQAQDLAMAEEPTSLIIEHLGSLRAEVADMRTVLLASIDRTRRVEERIEEMRDDLEIMIKAELVGRLGNVEAHVDARLDAMREQVEVGTA